MAIYRGRRKRERERGASFFSGGRGLLMNAACRWPIMGSDMPGQRSDSTGVSGQCVCECGVVVVCCACVCECLQYNTQSSIWVSQQLERESGKGQHWVKPEIWKRADGWYTVPVLAISGQ